MSEIEQNAEDFNRSKVLDSLSYKDLVVLIANRLQGVKANIEAMNELLAEYDLRIGKL